MVFPNEVKTGIGKNSANRKEYPNLDKSPS